MGLRHIAKIDILKINPTPIATPAKEIDGILLAEYLKPSRITMNKSNKSRMNRNYNNWNN